MGSEFGILGFAVGDDCDDDDGDEEDSECGREPVEQVKRGVEAAGAVVGVDGAIRLLGQSRDGGPEGECCGELAMNTQSGRSPGLTCEVATSMMKTAAEVAACRQEAALIQSTPAV
jgi:hypothetical protein